MTRIFTMAMMAMTLALAACTSGQDSRIAQHGTYGPDPNGPLQPSASHAP